MERLCLGLRIELETQGHGRERPFTFLLRAYHLRLDGQGPAAVRPADPRELQVALAAAALWALWRTDCCLPETEFHQLVQLSYLS